jgi:hypothetical protein
MDVRLLAVGLALALAGCATPDGGQNFSTDITDRGLSNDDIRIVETAVRPTLKDPASGVFRGITSTRSDDGHKFVCGWVDYKRPNGALAGEQPFDGTLFAGQFVLGTLAHDETSAATVFSECQAHNVRL